MLKRLICIVLTAALALGMVSVAPIKAKAASDMSVSDACVELIKLLEGFTAVPKWDYSQWTVGFGTACPDEDLDRYLKTGIPVDEAEELLAEKLVYFNGRVNKFADDYDLTLTQGQFDAIFSLTYNIGAAWMSRPTGLFHKAVTSGATGNELIAALSASCTAGGKFIKGLMTRRLAEAEMYLYGHYNRQPPEAYCYVTYDAGKGEREVAAQGYDSRLPAWPMAKATYEGHIFLGWYTKPEGGSRVTSLDASMDGMTLYAHWLENPSQDTEQKTTHVRVTGDRVNVRSGPGLSYGVLAKVNTGDELVITKVQNADGLQWGQSELGWICLDYTNYEEAVNSGENDRFEIQLPSEKTFAVITASVINVRSGPGAEYGLITSMRQGDVTEVYAFATVGDKIWGMCATGWFRITGYASLYHPGDGGSGQPGATNPEVTEPIEPEEPVVFPEVPAVGTVIGSKAVSLYNGPHKSYPELGQVQVGAELEILEFMFFMGDTWGRTKNGWVCVNSNMMIHGEDSFINTFVVTVTNDTLNLRTGPGASNKKVGMLVKGDKAEIFELAEYEGDPWGRTERGWISLKFTNYHPSMVPDQTPPLTGCEAGDHPYAVISSDASCVSDGYTIYICELCGHSYLGEIVPATAHSYVTRSKEATCTESGYTTELCESCGDVRWQNEIPATGHNYMEGTKEPTCTDPGFVGLVCLFCGEGEGHTELPAMGHSYNAQVIAPSCGQEGYTQYTCDRCGHSYEDDYVPSIRHSYVRSVVAPTCTEEGYTAYTCSHCGLVQKKDVVQAQGHRGTGVVTLPTCKDPGYTTNTCRVCGLIWTDNEVPPTGDHNAVSVVTAPTCGKPGYTTHTCKDCGTVTVDSDVPATNQHNYMSVVTPATKESQGYTTHTCKACGHSYVDSYTEKLPNVQIVEVQKTFATITVSSVNVRSGPGAENGKVTVLRLGNKVEILEQKDLGGKIWGRYEGGWFRLTGYATLETVTERIEIDVPDPGPGGNEPNPPVVEPDPPAVEPDPPVVEPDPGEGGEVTTMTKVYATVIVNTLNVRSGPGTNHSKVSKLHDGDKVEILEQQEVDGRNWGRYDGGWICLSENAELETVTEEVPGSGGNEPNPPAVEPVEPDPPVVDPGQGDEPATVTKTYATITANAVNVRSGPGAEHGKVAILHKGDRVEILEQKQIGEKLWGRTENGWFRMNGYATIETVEVQE